MEQALSNGTIRTVYTPQFGYPSGLAVDSNAVYWTNFYYGATVYKIAK